MADVNQTSIQLPSIVKFVMPAQHAMVLLSALEAHGPYRDVNPVIVNLQQQLIGQQPKPNDPPPSYPSRVFPDVASRPAESASERGTPADYPPDVFPADLND